MVNNREEKYDADREDVEYHFTDEEVSYDVETEAETAQPATVQESKPSFLTRLPRSKRMIVSVVVFLILLFIAYKMVAPTTTQRPAIDINSAPAVQPAVSNTSLQRTPVAQVPVKPAQPITTTAISTAPAPLITQPVTTNPVANNSNLATTTMVQTTTTPGMPAVIPVQTTTPVTGGLDSAAAAIAAENEKQINQMHVEALQKANEFATQNKVLQQQIQELNTRVANLEGQITQLVQTLTRANNPSNAMTATAGGDNNATAAAAPPVQAQESDVRPPYNVQAIIPGRAWLRSDSGETVTVAEGDMIRDLGRVTKIDPYNGVVEINTGTKVISLSYGSGG